MRSNLSTALSLSVCHRSSQTALSRLTSGHLKSLSFNEDRKVFAICTKFHDQHASPEHILECLGLTRNGLISDPHLVLDFIRVNNLVDLIRLMLVNGVLATTKTKGASAILWRAITGAIIILLKYFSTSTVGFLLPTIVKNVCDDFCHVKDIPKLVNFYRLMNHINIAQAVK